MFPAYVFHLKLQKGSVLFGLLPAVLREQVASDGKIDGGDGHGKQIQQENACRASGIMLRIKGRCQEKDDECAGDQGQNAPALFDHANKIKPDMPHTVKIKQNHGQIE